MRIRKTAFVSYRYQITPVGRPCHTKLDYGPWQIKLETLLEFWTGRCFRTQHRLILRVKMSEAKLSLAVFRSLACRPCDNCTKPHFTLSTRLIKPPYAHLEGVWSRCVCSMGPGDDAPIVGGESAQSHPTREASYTLLNAMNSQRWGNVHRECLSFDCHWSSLYTFIHSCITRVKIFIPVWNLSS